MDFHKEQQTRIDKCRAEIGVLTYERLKLTRQIERMTADIANIDRLIDEKELTILSANQAQRDFNSYLAVKEGAITLDQLKEGIEAGGGNQ